MESRAAYGYYGIGYGTTGETQPTKAHASGWHICNFTFEIAGTPQQTSGCKYFEVNARDYEHALKQMKKYAKRDGFTIVGLAKGEEWKKEKFKD